MPSPRSRFSSPLCSSRSASSVSAAPIPIFRADSRSQYTLILGAGEISLDFIGGFHNKSPATPEWHADHTSTPISMGQQALAATGRPQRFYERLGFYFISGATSPQWMGRLSLIGAPLWFLLLVFSAPPVLWLRNHLQARRALRVGHCPVCGYDLRTTPDRCPECGAVPPDSSRANDQSPA